MNKEISIDEEFQGKIETALEIRYKSLNLNEFPLKFTNLFSGINLGHSTSLGITDIDYKKNKIKDWNLKLYLSESIKMLEIKGKEFKLGIQVEQLAGGIIVPNGSGFYYEIYEHVNNSRLLWLINFLIELFSGEELTFKTKKARGIIQIENQVEVIKLKLLKETIESLTEHFPKQKILEIKNSICTLQLLNIFEKNISFESWLNFDFENNYEILSGDKIIFTRAHNYEINSKSFTILEKIAINDPVSKDEIRQDRIRACRKVCKITLERLN